jgi:hypothetical protein
VTHSPLAVDDIIHGFAHGAFGRDHYDCVRIEAVGPDWIVARSHREPYEREPDPSFASGRRQLELCQQARDERCQNDAGLCPLADVELPLTAWKATP